MIKSYQSRNYLWAPIIHQTRKKQRVYEPLQSHAMNSSIRRNPCLTKMSATTFDSLFLWDIVNPGSVFDAFRMKFRMKLRFQGPPLSSRHHCTAFFESDSIKVCDGLRRSHFCEIVIALCIAKNFCIVYFHGGNWCEEDTHKVSIKVSKYTSNGRFMGGWVIGCINIPLQMIRRRRAPYWTRRWWSGL